MLAFKGGKRTSVTISDQLRTLLCDILRDLLCDLLCDDGAADVSADVKAHEVAACVHGCVGSTPDWFTVRFGAVSFGVERRCGATAGALCDVSGFGVGGGAGVMLGVDSC